MRSLLVEKELQGNFSFAEGWIQIGIQFFPFSSLTAKWS